MPAEDSVGAAKHRCALALSAQAGSTSTGSPTAYSQHQPSPINQENLRLKEQKKLAPTVRGNWSLGEAVTPAT